MSDYEQLTRSERRALERPFHMDSGYVLDFSNRTIDHFFEDNFRIEFYSLAYATNGDSKAKRLRTVLGLSSNGQCSAILRKLWEYRSTLSGYYLGESPELEEEIQKAFYSVLTKLDGDSTISMVAQSLENFDDTNTLSNLINSIERDVRDDRFAAALDRLHTYCQRKFRILLEKNGRDVMESSPLHSRVGEYCKVLESENRLSAMTVYIIKTSISVFQKFNDIRNRESLAHDNELINSQEARYIVASICNLLRFMKSIEATDFGN